MAPHESNVEVGEDNAFVRWLVMRGVTIKIARQVKRNLMRFQSPKPGGARPPQ
jgi:hypothetical protein